MSSARIRSIVAFVVVACVVYFAYRNVYANPRAESIDKIGVIRGDIEQFRTRLGEHTDVERRLDRIASTTLGGDAAQVEHRLRRALGEIGRHAGLQDIVVDSGTPRAAPNPAGSSMPRIGGDFGKMLKQGADFYVVSASLRGVGTLDDALEALAIVQSQAWAHRVGSVTIKPEGLARELFEIRIDAISTLLMPDLVDADAPAPSWSPVNDSATARWAPIVSKNVFRTPVAPPVESPAPTPEPIAGTAPPAPPYADWKLTGLPSGQSGSVAGLSNTKTGENLLLEVGGTVLDAQLFEVDRFSAVFEIGESRFVVQIGQTLAQRQEIP
jgi:hypothetical protein